MDLSNLSFCGGGVSLQQEMANILAQKQLRSIILTVSTQVQWLLVGEEWSRAFVYFSPLWASVRGLFWDLPLG